MSMWDMVQQAQIRGMRRNQSISESDSLQRNRRQDDRTDQLEDRIDKLTDLIEAMWDVLSVRTGATDDQLADAVADVIEQRQSEKQPVPCVRCGAAVLRSEFRCQFCGAERVDPVAPPAPPTSF